MELRASSHPSPSTGIAAPRHIESTRIRGEAYDHADYNHRKNFDRHKPGDAAGREQERDGAEEHRERSQQAFTNRLRTIQFFLRVDAAHAKI